LGVLSGGSGALWAAGIVDRDSLSGAGACWGGLAGAVGGGSGGVSVAAAATSVFAGSAVGAGAAADGSLALLGGEAACAAGDGMTVCVARSGATVRSEAGASTACGLGCDGSGLEAARSDPDRATCIAAPTQMAPASARPVAT
jgi:hypothetical protein